MARFTAETALSLREVRSAVALRLPAYMMPNLFEQVDQMPLLSSGKIDRSKLATMPLPQSIQEEFRDRHLEDDASLLIAEAMGELLGSPEIAVTEDFFHLGGHSLLAIQLAARLEELFGQPVPVAVLFQASTPRSLAHHLKQSQGAIARHIVPLQPHGAKPPIFCTHLSDGKIHYYLSLVRSLAKDQPAYGICPADLGPRVSKRSLSIEDLAAFHLQELRRVRPLGPYVLCGYSAGGSLAYEMARTLLNQGESVRLLLIDSFAPPPIREKLRFTRIKFFRKDLVRVAIHFVLRNRTPFRRAAKQSIRRITSKRQPIPADNESRLAEVLDQAQKQYKPGPYKGKLLLVHSENDRLHSRLQVEELHYWDRYVTGEISVIRLPGNHAQIMATPLAARTATLLQQALADWDKTGSEG